MRVGYILLDGCGDRPSPALNFTTPLESANTPHLDSLAQRSKMGQVITVGRGVSPESDIAVFNMLGYSFEEGGYPGRGVVESIGSGLEVRQGDLALRANFATASNGKITDRRAGRDITKEDSKMLQEAVSGIRLRDAEFEFRSTVGHRAVLVIRASRPLSGEISNTDPGYARVKGYGAALETKDVEDVQTCKPLEATEEARLAAQLLNEFSAKAMEALDSASVNQQRRRTGKKPANILLFRDAGSSVPKLPTFRERHGLRGVALVDMPAEVGIAMMLDMKMVKVEDHTDLGRKAELLKKEMKQDDTVVYAHIKGPDEFGHDGDAPGKKSNIESIDRDFFSQVAGEFLAGGWGEAARIAVSCDHSTPCILKMHSSDPVPLLITSDSGKRDCCRFTENDSKGGSIGTIAGKTVLDRVLGA